MTNKYISDLTAATTPLAGTELIPVWDGTATKKVSVDNLTSGKPVSTGPLTVTGDETITGSVMVGATTTAGNINNSKGVIGGVFSTASGTVAIPNATATTIVTLPNLGTGVFIITASIPGAGGASSYAATALITTQTTSSVVSNLHGTAVITFTLSGLDVQVTHTAGTTYTFAWTVLRLT
jgi:hypothetical protein